MPFSHKEVQLSKSLKPSPTLSSWKINTKNLILYVKVSNVEKSKVKWMDENTQACLHSQINIYCAIVC